MRSLLRLLGVAALLAIVAACSSSADDSVVAPEPRTDEDLAIAWWEWATIEPDATNPVVDVTGEHCGLNQPTDVWFLANTFGTDANRSCTVAQTEIFFPVLNALCGGNGDCTTTYDDADIQVTLDGDPVSPIEIDTTPGEITMEPGNPFEPDGGEFRVVAAGWWVRLPALDVGEHVLVFSGSGDDIELTVQYDLTVAA